MFPVTAAIYQNGEEKPVMRLSFEMGIGGESDKLCDFIIPLHSQLPAMFTCRDGKGGKLSSQASKMLCQLPGAVYIAS